jgi:hypothetical protein
MGLKLERIEAIDGRELSPNERIGLFRNVNEVACWKSHLKAVTHAISITTKYALIVEDDMIWRSTARDFFDTFDYHSLPKSDMLFYTLGYFSLPSSSSISEEGNWNRMYPTFGAHCYLVARNKAALLAGYLGRCHAAVDKFLTTTKRNWVLSTSIADQRISASDLNNETPLAGTFYVRAFNRPKLLDWWGSVEEAMFSETVESTPKILHILPGQRWQFTLPEGWEIREWKFYDEIPSYERFARRIPFAWWVIAKEGGLVFPEILTDWVERYYSSTKITWHKDYICAPKGTMGVRNRIRLLLNIVPTN